MDIKAGQIITMKPEFLEPGEENLPHVALEDSFEGWNSIKVEIAGDYKYPFKPINDWRLEWIA